MIQNKMKRQQKLNDLLEDRLQKKKQKTRQLFWTKDLMSNIQSRRVDETSIQRKDKNHIPDAVLKSMQSKTKQNFFASVPDLNSGAR